MKRKVTDPGKEAPATRGRWIDRTEDDDGLYEFCSLCGHDVDITHYGISYPHCPYCGAKMEVQDE